MQLPVFLSLSLFLRETFFGGNLLSLMFFFSPAVSECGLATYGTVISGFPNGWFQPAQKNLCEISKEVKEGGNMIGETKA